MVINVERIAAFIGSRFSGVKKRTNGMYIRHKLRGWLWAVIRAVLLIGIAYVILFPLLSKIISAFMVYEDTFDKTVKWIPKTVTLENFKLAFQYMNYPKALFNSLLLSLSVAVLQTLSSAFIGYGFARFKFSFCRLLFVCVIVLLLVPPQIIHIPLYLNFHFFDLFGLLPNGGINLLGNIVPFLILSVFGVGPRAGLFIFIMRQSYLRVPRELEEAARVDGCGPFKTFFRIIVPSSVASITVVFLFSLVWQYNDAYWTNLFANDMFVLSKALEGLELAVHMGAGIRGAAISLVQNAGMIWFLLPLIVIYIFTQKFFIESITHAGLK